MTAVLSIVVPVFRVEDYLRECLDSMLSYGGTDLEVIAVDDGSDDGCPQILDAYAAADPRLVAVHLPGNVGLGQARNAGLDQATGEYVWFVDSDDWLPADAVGLVIDRLRSIRPDVLIIDHAEVFPDGTAVVKPVLADFLDGADVPLHLSQRPQLLRLAQSACTKIARRDLLERTGLRFAPGWYEDSYFSHALMMSAERIDALTQDCYCYRQRTPGSITSTLSPRHFEVFEQYHRLFSLVEASDGALDIFRPELFRLMINHYLVIVGNQWRLPAELRRDFFARVAREYEVYKPAGAYPIRGGMEALKHLLVRRKAYALYASLRMVHLALSRGRADRVRSDSHPHPELMPPAGKGSPRAVRRRGAKGRTEASKAAQGAADQFGGSRAP